VDGYEACVADEGDSGAVEGSLGVDKLKIFLVALKFMGLKIMGLMMRKQTTLRVLFPENSYPFSQKFQSF